MTSATVAVVFAAVLLRLTGLAVASLVAGSPDKAVFGWDGALYLQIAHAGYPPGQPLAGAANWAFFPAWPAALAVMVRVSLSPTILVVGWGIVLTIVDVLLLVRLLGPRVGSREAALVAVAWAAAPPNWVYLAAYSEGLFVALQLVLLLAMQARRPAATWGSRSSSAWPAPRARSGRLRRRGGSTGTPGPARGDCSCPSWRSPARRSGRSP